MIEDALSFSEAVALHQTGRLDDAGRIYRQILDADPNHASALHLLGVVHHQQSEHEKAIELIGRAIEIEPAKAVYHNNYGAALLALRRYDEAMAAFDKALSIRPQYADALANRGMTFTALDRHGEALASFRAALAIEPKHRDARSRLISALHRIGRSSEAVEMCRRAIAVQPFAEFHAKLGELLIVMERPEEAVECLKKAIALQADYAVAHFNAGVALENRSDHLAAQNYFARAAALCPRKPLWQLRAKMCAPAVFEDAAAIEEYCRRVEAAIDEVERTYSSRSAVMTGDTADGTPSTADGTRSVPATLPRDEYIDAFEAGAFPGIAFSYHGRNQRALKKRFAQFYEPCFSKQPPPEGSGITDRKRIGILVTRRHENIFLRVMRGIIDGLDRDRFEVVILTSKASADSMAKQFDSRTQVVPIGDSLRDAIGQVREARCDLIYYWEVGTDPLNYFLPFARLAPVQATGWGTAITSGVSAVDYFLSSELIERPGSEAQYTEQLWKSRTLFCYQDRLRSDGPVNRNEFALPDERRIYICLQNPLKIHPDFDAILAGILQADSKALIVLLADEPGNIARGLQQRFARKIGNADRIIFLPRRPFPEYCRLLQVADVILDPLHFGGGCTSYDLFSFNLPVVTLPGELIVGRVTQACYRKMGVLDLIVQSPEEYVAKAVQVASDREYREYVVRKIAQSSDLLFNDIEVVREHERFFDEAIKNA